MFASDTHSVPYCQAQPQFQLSWAELALFLIPPAARPAGHPPGRSSSELAGNQHNLLCNIGRSTQVELKTICQNFEKMEDDLQGRRPPGKTTSIEDDF